ncbi:MAG: response regulator, partial [Lachnospiraceae bacterium]|nr:response regulator [Lachnospiraceae bacterium]
IICLDHMMPEMDGIETLDRMHAGDLLPDHTVVLAMTANAVVGAKEMYLERGFDDYISKPIEVEVLIRKLRKHLPPEKIREEKTYGGEVALEFSPSEATDSEPADVMPKLEALGLDVKQGLSHCMDDEEFYLELVSDFYKGQKEKSLELQQFLDKEDAKEYAVLAHAIKGNARTLGIPDLPDRALQLEEAGKRGDMDFIKENHAAFLSEYEKTANEIKTVFE